jgi:hypothetical protein
MKGEYFMSSENTIQALQDYCTKNSGDKFGQIWQGKNATYHWNTGRPTSGGLVNGVVRKLAGVDAIGKQIWVVAGSFKIADNGTILRFTGLPKKDQVLLSNVGSLTAKAAQLVKETELV